MIDHDHVSGASAEADQALVCDQAASRLSPSGFDPSRFVAELRAMKYKSQRGDRNLAGAIFEGVLELVATAAEKAVLSRDSDRNPEGEDRNGLRASHESAGREPASPNPEQESQQ